MDQWLRFNNFLKFNFNFKKWQNHDEREGERKKQQATTTTGNYGRKTEQKNLNAPTMKPRRRRVLLWADVQISENAMRDYFFQRRRERPLPLRSASSSPPSSSTATVSSHGCVARPPYHTVVVQSLFHSAAVGHLPAHHRWRALPRRTIVPSYGFRCLSCRKSLHYEFLLSPSFPWQPLLC